MGIQFLTLQILKCCQGLQYYAQVEAHLGPVTNAMGYSLLAVNQK